MKFCTNCGQQLDDAVVFCSECGTRAPEAKPIPQESPAPTPKYCINCGWEIAPGKVFCTHCGTRATEETVVSEAMADESLWVAHAQQTTQNETSSQEESPRRSRKSPFDEPLLPVEAPSVVKNT